MIPGDKNWDSQIELDGRESRRREKRRTRITIVQAARPLVKKKEKRSLRRISFTRGKVERGRKCEYLHAQQHTNVSLSFK